MIIPFEQLTRPARAEAPRVLACQLAQEPGQLRLTVDGYGEAVVKLTPPDAGQGEFELLAEEASRGQEFHARVSQWLDMPFGVPPSAAELRPLRGRFSRDGERVVLDVGDWARIYVERDEVGSAARLLLGSPWTWQRRDLHALLTCALRGGTAPVLTPVSQRRPDPPSRHLRFGPLHDVALCFVERVQPRDRGFSGLVDFLRRPESLSFDAAQELTATLTAARRLYSGPLRLTEYPDAPVAGRGGRPIADVDLYELDDRQRLRLRIADAVETGGLTRWEELERLAPLLSPGRPMVALALVAVHGHPEAAGRAAALAASQGAWPEDAAWLRWLAGEPVSSEALAGRLPDAHRSASPLALRAALTESWTAALNAVSKKFRETEDEPLRPAATAPPRLLVQYVAFRQGRGVSAEVLRASFEALFRWAAKPLFLSSDAQRLSSMLPFVELYRRAFEEVSPAQLLASRVENAVWGKGLLPAADFEVPDKVRSYLDELGGFFEEAVRRREGVSVRRLLDSSELSFFLREPPG